jgi:hypothetical protein
LTERATDINNTNSTRSPRRETTAKETNAATQGNARPAPFNMRKRIGSIAYEVEVHFSPNSGETMDDKILRMVRGGAVKNDMEGRK